MLEWVLKMKDEQEEIINNVLEQSQLGDNQ